MNQNESNSLLDNIDSNIIKAPNTVLTNNDTKEVPNEEKTKKAVIFELIPKTRRREIHYLIKNKKWFPCQFQDCKKEFNYRWLLDRHINSHFSFRLFKCAENGCSKSYKSQENLKLHLYNYHFNIKPYKCGYCSLMFSHRNGN